MAQMKFLTWLCYKNKVCCYYNPETVAVPCYLLRTSVGLTIFSMDSTTFLLPLITIDKKINSRILLALLLHFILLPYGLLRLRGKTEFHDLAKSFSLLLNSLTASRD